MLEQELVALVRSFLAKPRGTATAEECLAWAEFFVTYDLVIRDNIRRLHNVWNIIDDISQDVWIIIIRRLPRWTFDPARGTIGAWVSKIAQRLAVKRARRHSRQQSGSLSKTQDDTLVDPEPGPDTEFERLQQHELFGALVLDFAASLHKRGGRVVVMHWVEACSLLKIAFDLNMSEGAVWGVIRRARPKLLDFLRRRGLRPN